MFIAGLMSAALVLANACDGERDPPHAEPRLGSVPDAPFAMPALNNWLVPRRDFVVTDYGAAAGKKCTAAFAAAFEAAERAGGGRVVVPDGEWLTGAVHLRSNCALHLAKDAKLVFTDDPADYPEVFTSWEGTECYNHSPLIYAFGCTNVAITGQGLIEPQMKRWSEEWSGYDEKQMAATKELYCWGATNAPLSVRRLMSIDGAQARPQLIQFNQ